MNILLVTARKFLRQGATLACAMADGMVTIPEAAKIKLKGMLDEVNLVHEIPDKSILAIPTWDQLTEDEQNFVRTIPGQTVEVPEHIAELAYEAAVKRYEITAAFLKLDDVPENDLPPVATTKKLSEVTGIGKTVQGVLETLGIKTVEALASANAESLKEGLTKAGLMAPIASKAPEYIANAKILLGHE